MVLEKCLSPDTQVSMIAPAMTPFTGSVDFILN